jgi:hypothetical protein
MRCQGPANSSLATFVLEAGGGSPGVSLAGIADALAAAGRRVCWYDRLGYGWSDDAIKPTTARRVGAASRRQRSTCAAQLGACTKRVCSPAQHASRTPPPARRRRWRFETYWPPPASAAPLW